MPKLEKLSLLNYVYRFFDIIVLFFIVFDFGYDHADNFTSPHVLGLIALSILLLGFNTAKLFVYKYKSNKRVIAVNVLIISILLVSSLVVWLTHIHNDYHFILQKIKPILELGLILYFLLRLLVLVRYIYNVYYNPTIVFVGSFFILAILGAFLLMLPSATVNGISFTNALFTATSAACVTGLAVLDTSRDFTIIGQSIILVLIQLGGLGILTFTSFFAFFFRGSSSFKESLNTKNFIAQDGLKDVFRAALNVVTFTVALELVGAVCLFTCPYRIATLFKTNCFSLFFTLFLPFVMQGSPHCPRDYLNRVSVLTTPFSGSLWFLLLLEAWGITSFLTFIKKLKFLSWKFWTELPSTSEFQ